MQLVDIVCLEDGTLSDVLRQHGWTKNAKLIADLQSALRAVLDRMMGPAIRANQRAITFSEGRTNPIFG
ncbi:hypothetical protein [Shimia isoporae]|uniref:hypothetical protein n=1 Tax=Shimia isoporae TaxID=647720 RepID=UPI001047DCC0|nr:hypothetical protein [Shimia isoporae]